MLCPNPMQFGQIDPELQRFEVQQKTSIFKDLWTKAKMLLLSNFEVLPKTQILKGKSQKNWAWSLGIGQRDRLLRTHICSLFSSGHALENGRNEQYRKRPFSSILKQP